MKKLFLTVLSMMFLLLITVNVQAATYYISPSGSDDSGSGTADYPWATLYKAYSEMSGGDTLILKDGTYTGNSNRVLGDSSEHYPPVGTSGNWTKIEAENIGQAIIDGEDTNNMFYVDAGGDMYWEFRGIHWRRSTTSDPMIQCVGISYVKFIDCGAEDGGYNGVGFNFNNCSYMLCDRCYAWGRQRYQFSSYKSSYILFRQCVGRKEAHYPSITMPIAGFAIYTTSHCRVQNCIIVDSNQSSLWDVSYVEEYGGAFYTPGTAGSSTDVEFNQCIGLNNDLGFIGLAENSTASWINCVLWDLYRPNDTDAMNTVRGTGTVTNCTFGVGTAHSTPTNTYAINGYDTGTSQTLKNSIFYDFSSDFDACLYGIETEDYNCYYANSCSTGAGDSHNITGTDPTSNSLLYLPRIESGSDLDGAGESGADIGATALTLVGTSETIWGETGYDTDTGEDMWPFPNEDLIKTKMSTYARDSSDGKRGFCANTANANTDTGYVTLTSYIWEYLGSEIPSDIYAGSPLSITTAALESGSSGISYSQTVSVSGGTAPYTWSVSSGSLPDGLTFGSGTGIISGTPTVADTFNFTIQVMDSALDTDTQSLSIVISESDSIAPVISAVLSSGLSDEEATITWTTDELATSQVEYGTTVSYGSSTDINTSMVTSHSVTLSGLASSTTYHFRVKSKDAAENLGTTSDYTFSTAATADTTAPSTVSDLSVQDAGASSITVSWTAPGDDGSSGTAASYDLRYSLTGDSWEGATQATGEPSPSVAGSTEIFTITGLDSMTTYYLALTAFDESSNESDLSNIVSATTSSSVTDTTPPYTFGHSPAKNAIDIEPDTDIVLHVKDDGSGVDIDTIVMKVNGVRVTPTITGTSADYTLTYDPSADFDTGDTVTVTVEASDLAD